MLVLSRKKGERILIDEAIEITVVEVRSNRVKLAFQCPGSIRIVREEVVDRFKTEESRSALDPSISHI